MHLIPALDIKNGACVGLIRKDLSNVRFYHHDPVEKAQEFAAQGFEWLHIVDLNGAVEGYSVNSSVIEKLLNDVPIKVQLGGGVRSMESISYWFERGASRVVLGTVALSKPEIVLEAAARYGDKILVSIDAKDAYVAMAGWDQSSSMRVLDLALKFDQCGLGGFIYTDVNRDGAMAGIDVEMASDLAFSLATPLFISGGLSSLDELRLIKKDENLGIEAIICGRALYNGRLDAKEALQILKE